MSSHEAHAFLHGLSNMDDDPFKNKISNMYCTNETEVQYFNVQHGTWELLVCNLAFEEKVQCMRRLVDGEEVIPDMNYSQGSNGRAPFIVILAQGEPTFKDSPLSLSIHSMRSLLSNGILDSHLVTTYSLTQQHFSYHVQYDDSEIQPISMYVYLRLPRNSRMINVSMQIRLSNLACVAFISSRAPQVITDLRSRILDERPVLQKHPLYFLVFALERRKQDFHDWVEGLWKHVGHLEAKTGMTPWRNNPREVVPNLEAEDMTDLLQKLHAVGVELRLAQTLMTFTTDLGAQFLTVAQKINEFRAGIGAEQIRPGVKVGLELDVEHNSTILDNLRVKILELLGRANAQINVTYSLIAQKSSEQNIRIAQGSRDIAELARDDSRTMKTITVLTLVFLPSTMLAPLWDAGIFRLDADKSWRVYIGTTFALTLFVFCIWYLYIWISNKQRLRERLLPRIDATLEKGNKS